MRECIYLHTYIHAQEAEAHCLSVSTAQAQAWHKVSVPAWMWGILMYSYICDECAYTYTYANRCMCIHKHTYAYIYIYTCIYMYIHTQTNRDTAAHIHIHISIHITYTHIHFIHCPIFSGRRLLVDLCLISTLPRFWHTAMLCSCARVLIYQGSNPWHARHKRMRSRTYAYIHNVWPMFMRRGQYSMWEVPDTWLPLS